MTESQWLAWVRSALRSKWLRWKPRADALRAAQEPYKGENKRQKFAYRCAMCNNLFSQKDVEVDHFPRDAGSILSVDDIGEFCNNLFCETDNLRVVCKPCHSVYTLSKRNGISLEEARLQKSITEFMKKSKTEVVAFCKDFGYNDVSLSNAAKRREAVESILREKMSA
jgi:hypothetical protein